MSDRISARWIGPALALVSLTLFALGAELVLRVVNAFERDRLIARDPTRELCTEPDPELVYRYVAGRCGNNAQGYRDSDHAREKSPGVFRFVVIGDSVAAGDDVALEERFDRVLERRLADAGVRAEAVNLARTGYSTSQELMVLEREGYAYHPDVVIWSYVANDPADPIHHNANGRLGRFYVRPRVYVWNALQHLMFKLRERVAARGCPEEFHLYLHCAYRARVAADIARIGALASEHATPTIFVIHPIFERDHGFADSSFRELFTELAQRAREAGLEVVELLPAYAQYARADLQQKPATGWFDPWHPNARGHAVAAEAIEPALLRLRAAAHGDRLGQ